MAKRSPVLVLGEALVDVVHANGEINEHVGGSPANVAFGLGRLEHDVTLAAWFAKDERGERIAQMVVAPVTRATLIEVTELPATARGAGGFGSTGRS